MKVPSNGWLISFTMENPIELDDLGVPPNHRKPPVTTWSQHVVPEPSQVGMAVAQVIFSFADLGMVICYIATEHDPLIVDLAIRDGDFPQLCKRLPEDMFLQIGIT